MVKVSKFFGAMWRFGLAHKAILVCLLTLMAIVLVQHVTWLAGRPLARIQVDSQSVGLFMRSNGTVEEAASLSEKATITLHLEKEESDVKPEKVSIEKSGIRVDTQQLTNDIRKYSPLNLVPFGSIVFKKSYDSRQYFVGNKDSEVFFSNLADTHSVKPIDATVVKQEKALAIQGDVSGKTFSPDELEQKVITGVQANKSIVAAAAKDVRSSKTVDTLKPFVEEIEKKIAHPYTFVQGAKKYTIESSEELITLVDIYVDEESGDQKYRLSEEATKGYLGAKLNPIYGTQATDTVVVQENGSEVDRIPGRNGQEVDVNALFSKMQDSFMSTSDQPIELSLKTVASKIITIKRYGKTQADLQNLLNDLGSQYGDVSISVQELYGNYRTAHYQGSKQRVAASTYKLLVAYAVGQKITSSEWSWDTPILGVSTDQCMQRMIVRSDNPCPEAWVYSVMGANHVNAVGRSLGMTNTCFGCSYAQSSTSDQLKILNAIRTSNGMSSEVSGRILGYMNSQIYRQGIPKGTGYRVANKPGFLEGYLNDSAIVYIKDGPLLLSIYTNNKSWSTIASITARIIENTTY